MKTCYIKTKKESDSVLAELNIAILLHRTPVLKEEQRKTTRDYLPILQSYVLSFQQTVSVSSGIDWDIETCCSFQILKYPIV